MLHCKEVTLQAPIIVAKSNNVIGFLSGLALPTHCFLILAIFIAFFVFCFFGARSILGFLRQFTCVRKLLHDIGCFFALLGPVRQFPIKYRGTEKAPNGAFVFEEQAPGPSIWPVRLQESLQGQVPDQPSADPVRQDHRSPQALLVSLPLFRLGRSFAALAPLGPVVFSLDPRHSPDH